jgi:peptidoglycan/xylan/chitin deacetylase (PgdA/CDA1 family)
VTVFRRVARSLAAGIAGRALARAEAAAARGGPALAVLVYHRVVPDRGPDPWSLEVTASTFASQLDLVSEHYPVLPLDQGLELLHAGTLPGPRAVCLTFDDGYRDNRTRAAPLLAARGLPATLFLATGYAASGRPYWWDRAARSGIRLDHAAHRRARALPREARRAWLDSLGPESPPTDPDSLPLDFDELRGLPPSITVAGHGHDHLSLGLSESAVAAQDVARCREALQRELPRHLPLFAYPFGSPEDVGTEAPRMVRDHGFRAAFTTTEGVVRAGSDPFRLPRLYMTEAGPGALALRLLRAFHGGR